MLLRAADRTFGVFVVVILVLKHPQMEPRFGMRQMSVESRGSVVWIGDPMKSVLFASIRQPTHAETPTEYRSATNSRYQSSGGNRCKRSA